MKMLKSLDDNRINLDMLKSKTDVVLRPLSARFKSKKKKKKQGEGGSSTTRREKISLEKN